MLVKYYINVICYILIIWRQSYNVHKCHQSHPVTQSSKFHNLPMKSRVGSTKNAKVGLSGISSTSKHLICPTSLLAKLFLGYMS